MIVPMACAVEDDVFNAVKLICGDEVAWDLCYEDVSTFNEVKEFINVILDGHRMGIAKEDSA